MRKTITEGLVLDTRTADLTRPSGLYLLPAQAHAEDDPATVVVVNLYGGNDTPPADIGLMYRIGNLAPDVVMHTLREALLFASSAILSVSGLFCGIYGDGRADWREPEGELEKSAERRISDALERMRFYASAHDMLTTFGDLEDALIYAAVSDDLEVCAMRLEAELKAEGDWIRFDEMCEALVDAGAQWLEEYDEQHLPALSARLRGWIASHPTPACAEGLEA